MYCESKGNTYVTDFLLFIINYTFLSLEWNDFRSSGVFVIFFVRFYFLPVLKYVEF